MIGPRLQTFNDWLAEQGYPSGFRMGVGLNTGPVMCGNVGAEQRVEYTAIGDTTNTASRLEGMTKGGDHMLFVAEATREAMREVPEDLEFVEEFEVRGREAKMRVYSIPDPVGLARGVAAQARVSVQRSNLQSNDLGRGFRGVLREPPGR